jgi:hypothetical protein
MTTYFAFKLAEPTRKGLDELLGNLDAGVSAPQHDLHTRVSVELVDETLRNCVEELIARFQGSEGAGVLHTLLGLLKSTSHMLVRQILGKTGNDEVNRMAKYLRDRRLLLNGQPLFGFPMPDEMIARYRSIFADIAKGEGEKRKPELNQLMLQFTDLALVRFFDDFVAPMDLGFIKRKASDLGRATISKGMHVAVNRLIPSLGQKELEIYASYFDELFVKA